MTQTAGASEAIESAAAEGPPSTAARSSGSSFYTAMRVLPAPQRDAMYEIYAFCRAVDDIADGEAPQAERRAGLERWRADIDRLYAGEPPAGLGRLAATAKRFGLAREDFLAVIDGMEMDVEQDIRAPDFADLDLYCDRVASAVGRLSVRIFGLGEAEGRDLAHELGRALQLTNILRDLDEDAAVGRLYLPREALRGCGHRRARSGGGAGRSGAGPRLRRGRRARPRAFRRRRRHHRPLPAPRHSARPG